MTVFQSKTIFSVLIVALMSSLLVGCGGDSWMPGGSEESASDSGMNPDEVVLQVGDRSVTNKEYEQRLQDQKQLVKQQLGEIPEQQRAMMERQIARSLQEQLKNRMVLMNAARNAGIEVSSEDVDQFIEDELQEGQFEQIKNQLDVSEKELRDQLREDVLIQKYIDQNVEEVEVSDEEVRQQYEQQKERLAASSSGTEPPTFAEVEPRLRANLESQKEQKQIQDIVQPLIDKAEIEENWPEINVDTPELEMPESPKSKGDEAPATSQQ